jgi:hypothetical protein
MHNGHSGDMKKNTLVPESPGVITGPTVPSDFSREIS